MMETRVKKKQAPYEEQTVAWLEPVYPKSVLYREIDPFHRVFRFSEHVYSLHEECSAGGSDLWLNLIEGETAALLIDTGFGVGDLPALIRHLIGEKKLYVINTHEHGDHVMGNCRFDRVYCHEYAVPWITKRYMMPDILAPYRDEKGNGIYLDFGNADVPEYRGYELVPCREGDCFDLGDGQMIEVIETPGHAAGGISLLDRKNRILFTGAMHSGNTIVAGTQEMYRERNTVEAFLEALETIKDTYYDSFDKIFSTHEIPVLDKTYMLDEIQACKDVIADHTCSERTVIEAQGRVQYCHMVASAGLRFFETSFLDSE